MYNPCTFFVKCIPKYFIHFEAIISETVSLIFFLDCLLLVYRNTADFCILIVYINPATLPLTLFYR